MSSYLQHFLREHRGHRGVCSVCSANPLVIEAAMRQALADGTHLLLEATSNQVNQEGGYTGMTPAGFVDFVHTVAAQVCFPRDRLILGGDHLGPNPWQHLPSAEAMDRAEQMVRQYAAAGYLKIHLDASMRCADDPPALSDDEVARRASRLCAAAERSAKLPAAESISYVIGTEVPTPGGADHALSALAVTSAEAVEQTWEIHRDAFKEAGLQSAWERVIAIVVQPGVEFDHDRVIDYDPTKAGHLHRFLETHPELVMEAHSTDYQVASAYRNLVHDGFAILKVGPALTFALREALLALEAIETSLVPTERRSCLRATLERVMLARPGYWQRYYHGTALEQGRLRLYSYSDRLRYYWPDPAVQASLSRLIGNLERHAIPETLVSQHLPAAYKAIRAGTLHNTPTALALDHVRSVLRAYHAATSGRPSLT